MAARFPNRSPNARARGRISKRTRTALTRARPRTLVTELASIADSLDLIYCAAITVRGALVEQNAEHDVEFARCLMHHVADPVTLQANRLRSLIRSTTREAHDSATASAA